MRREEPDDDDLPLDLSPRARRAREASENARPTALEPAETVCGAHAVESLLDSTPRRIQRLLLLRANSDDRLHRLQARAEELRIPCQQIDARQLDLKSGGRKHQGVVALCNEREYADWNALREELIAEIAAGQAPVVLLAAAIEDPRNLGAMARTCVGLGVRALLLPVKGGCGLTPLAEETSAGALANLPVARPHDLETTLKDLARQGFRVIGLDADGMDIRACDLTGPILVVAGGEDRGIPPHLRRPCHQLAALPMSNRLQSYNASVAASMVLWEIARAR